MKPGTPLDVTMAAPVTLGAVSSTVTENEALAVLVALSVARTEYALAPAARAVLAVTAALRHA